MPVLREDGCIHPDDYEATSRRGFKASQSFPCKPCSIGPSHCAYLLGFRDLSDADQLCAAAIYHTHHDFYASHGNENRPILDLRRELRRFIIGADFDELCRLAELVKNGQSWNANHDVTKSFNKLVTWLQDIENAFSRSG